jgi:hypothetical protein
MSPFDSSGGPWIYGVIDKFVELVAKDVRIDVVSSLRSGAKVEQLGGLGRDLVLEKPRPTLFLSSDEVFGDSS